MVIFFFNRGWFVLSMIVSNSYFVTVDGRIVATYELKFVLSNAMLLIHESFGRWIIVLNRTFEYDYCMCQQHRIVDYFHPMLD